MRSIKKIGFNEAWKDFLVIRAIPYNFCSIIYFDSDQKITQINVEVLREIEIEGQRYFCDESTSPGMPLLYPKSVVFSEIESKIIKPFLGRQLKASEIASLRGRSQEVRRGIEAQLGRSARSEIQKAVLDKNYWEALFSLHQILEHRLRKMLLYKTAVCVDHSAKEILISDYSEKICQEIITFKQLAKTAFLVGAIDEETRERLVRFNTQRNNIAHKLLKMRIPSQVLMNLCSFGLDLMEALEKCFSETIPRPEFVEMTKFAIITL